MAVNCGVTNGMGLSCVQQRLTQGGVKSRIYIGNLGEVESFEFDSNGYMTAINWEDYATQGLHIFTGVKNQNSGSSDIAVTDGGNVSFNHTVQITLIDVTPQQKAVLEDMAYSSISDGVFVVMETAGGQFIVFGKDYGLTIETGPKSTGLAPTDSTTRVLTLSGGQSSLEKIFDTGSGVADTKARLNSYVISDQL